LLRACHGSSLRTCEQFPASVATLALFDAPSIGETRRTLPHCGVSACHHPEAGRNKAVGNSGTAKTDSADREWPDNGQLL
jgi:hypothetical protein